MTPSEHHQMTLNEALAEYTLLTQPQVAKETWRSARYLLNAMAVYVMESMGGKDPLVEDVANESRHVLLFFNERRAHVGPATFNLSLAQGRQFFDFCKDAGWIRACPLRNLRREKVPKKDRLAVSATELIDMIESAKEPRDRIALVMGSQLGLRQSEIFGLTVGKANFTNDTITVYQYKVKRERPQAMTAELRVELLRWLKHYATTMGVTIAELPTDWLLIPSRLVVGQDNLAEFAFGKRRVVYQPHIKMANTPRIVHEALRAIGIDEGQIKGTGFHVLRRSAGNQIVEYAKAAGHADPVAFAQELYGHQNRATTEHYLDRTSSAQALSDLLKGKPFLTLRAAQEAAEHADIRPESAGLRTVD